MTKQKLVVGGYDVWITLKKGVKAAAIWLLPQLALFLIDSYPQLEEMSVAFAVSALIHWFTDWLKHR